MTSAVMIRQVREDDLPRLKRLDELVFGQLAYPYFVLRQIFDVHEGQLLLAEQDGWLAGYSMGVATSVNGLGWLIGLGVDPAHRGQGIGGTLLRSSLANLQRIGIRRMRLTVDGKNLAAVGLYQKLGFRLLEEIDDYLGPGEARQLLEVDLARPGGG